MRITKSVLLLAGLALALAASCTTPRTADDGKASEAASHDDAAAYEPMRGWPKSN